MESVPLSIPFLSLSTEVKTSEGVRSHILTPFGYLDIVFPEECFREGAEPPREIKVLGDIECWKLDEDMPLEFRSTLLELVREIILRYLDRRGFETVPVAIRFVGGDMDVHIPCRMGGGRGTICSCATGGG